MLRAALSSAKPGGLCTSGSASGQWIRRGWDSRAEDTWLRLRGSDVSLQNSSGCSRARAPVGCARTEAVRPLTAVRLSLYPGNLLYGTCRLAAVYRNAAAPRPREPALRQWPHCRCLPQCGVPLLRQLALWQRHLRQPYWPWGGVCEKRSGFKAGAPTATVSAIQQVAHLF